MANKYEVDLGLKQITLYDSRWYGIPDLDKPVDDLGEPQYKFKFPSVTTILQAKSKGTALEKWMRGLGMNYEKTMDGLMSSGSKVHEACERLQKGETLTFLDDMGEEQYKFSEEWVKILTFKNWFEDNEVEPLMIEQTVYSKTGGFAGTLDMICRIKGEVWIIDIKSGSNVNTSYKMQGAAYFKAVNELEEIKHKPVKAGILTLDNPTKKKWRLTEVTNIDYMYDCFQAVKKIWEMDNPNFDMMNKMYPSEITLNKYLGGKK